MGKSRSLLPLVVGMTSSLKQRYGATRPLYSHDDVIPNPVIAGVDVIPNPGFAGVRDLLFLPLVVGTPAPRGAGVTTSWEETVPVTPRKKNP